MSQSVDREVYALILRLGRVTLRSFLEQALALISRQAAGSTAGHIFEVQGGRSAGSNQIQSHKALKEYRRLIWLGWRLNYELTPNDYTRPAVIVMRRGKRSRVIAISEERPLPD